MVIVRIEIENYKGIVKATLEPEDAVVALEGKNGQGKSSVLDAIGSALCGADWDKARAAKPLRAGAKSGKIELTLGNGMIVSRHYSASEEGTVTTRLEVRDDKGFTARKPQAILDELVGGVAFNPLSFADKEPKEQRDILLANFPVKIEEGDIAELRAVGIETAPKSVAEIEAEIALAFDARRAEKRRLAELDAVLAGMPREAGSYPVEDRDPSEILAKKDAFEAELAVWNGAYNREAGLRRRSLELKEKIERLKTELQDVEAEYDLAAADLLKLAKPVEPDLAAALEAIKSHNSQVAARRRYDEAVAAREGVAGVVGVLDKRVEVAREVKARIANRANPGLEGLTIAEDGLFFRGVPLSQASTSERLAVGIRLGMALNPSIRVLRVSDGQALDAGNLALVRELVAREGYQLWIERVLDQPTGSGFWIEAGEVKPAS